MTLDDANAEAKRRYGRTGLAQTIQNAKTGEPRKCVGVFLPVSEQFLVCGSVADSGTWEDAFAEADRNGLHQRADMHRFLEDLLAYRHTGGNGVHRETTAFWCDLTERAP